MVIPVVSDSIKHVIESSRDARCVYGLPSTRPESQQLHAEDSNRQHNNSLVHQSPRWSNPGSISTLRCLNLIGEHIPEFFNVKADHLGHLAESNHKSSKMIKNIRCYRNFRGTR
ncbi:hypothetical protein ACTFIU_009073 [Dictyostelium citrinum]